MKKLLVLLMVLVTVAGGMVFAAGASEVAATGSDLITVGYSQVGVNQIGVLLILNLSRAPL